MSDEFDGKNIDEMKSQLVDDKINIVSLLKILVKTLCSPNSI